MNDWDTIEKMINTLPQWDVIKWIMGIQEELKCAKEDNLYQLRQNKNLQSKIDKAIEFCDYSFKNPWYVSEKELLGKIIDILKLDSQCYRTMQNKKPYNKYKILVICKHNLGDDK